MVLNDLLFFAGIACLAAAAVGVSLSYRKKYAKMTPAEREKEWRDNEPY